MNENGKARQGALSRIFKVSERGSTAPQEIWAGIGACLIAVCALLLNTQLLGQYYGNFAGAYFAAALLALVGTVALGAIANLPVLTTASFGMSSLLVAYLGANEGLTYANLLFVTFVSALITLVIVLTPLKKFFIDAIPAGVQKALPVGVGLYVMMTGLEKSGLITAAHELASTKDLGSLPAFYFFLMLAALALVVVYLAVGRKNPLGSTYLMMLAAMWAIGIICYMEYFVGGQTATTLVYERVNLVVATDGASPYTFGIGLHSLKTFTPAALLSAGMDFSAFEEAGGQVTKFLVQSILTFVFMGLYMNYGTYQGAAAAGKLEEELVSKGERKVLAISALLNVAAPLLGSAPVGIGAQSAVETEDGAKTGLASLTAGIGFAIALCSWVFFALSATTTNGVGMWINDTETKLAAYVKDGFQFADLILVFAGAAMLKAMRKVDASKVEELAPFAITVAGTAFAGNIVAGIALGSLAYVLIALIRDRKSLKVSMAILAVVLTAYVVFTVMTGNGFVVVKNNFFMGPPPM